jgi:hypothetical protein
MRPPACGAARDAPADNYGRKLKPAAKKTRKYDKKRKTLKNPRKKGMQKLQIKEEIMAVAALLALGMLSILAGQAATLKPNAFDIEPKALWGACMYLAYTSGMNISGFTGIACLFGAGGFSNAIISRIFQPLANSARIAHMVRLVTVIRFFAYHPAGFLVLTA